MFLELIAMLSIAMNTIVRIQAYKDFYANYDAEKDFQRMKVLVFPSSSS